MIASKRSKKSFNWKGQFIAIVTGERVTMIDIYIVRLNGKKFVEI